MHWTRNKIYLALFFSLLIPVVLLTAVSALTDGVGVLLLVVSVLMLSSLFGRYVLGMWEKKMQASVTHLVQTKKLEEMREAHLEFEEVRQECHRLAEEKKHVQEELQNALQQKEALLNEYQKTISEQRVIIEKKRGYIARLEMKVRDLMDEMRTLLQQETAYEGESKELVGEQWVPDVFSLTSYSSRTVYDASIQLKKYIHKAENLTGVDHLGYIGGKAPRFLDPSLECYAVDRRRLCDSFKDEADGIVFIFSPLEKKFLFVNHVAKSLTGWSAEKFMKEFPNLIVKGYREWEEAIAKIKTHKEVSARLSLLDRNSQPRSFNCYMGAISKGPFSNHIAGLLIQHLA